MNYENHTSRLATENAVFRPALACALFAGAAPEQIMMPWNLIREKYQHHLPEILQVRATGLRSRLNPYFIDWIPLFTPIEMNAWCDIRYWGLPFYPQFPVANKFIDFADPFFKIGVELDGAAYHDKQKDRQRDEELYRLGWKIFRVTGRQSMPGPKEWPISEPLNTIDIEKVITWAIKHSEGFFWALRQFYYTHAPAKQYKIAAEHILASHTLVDFPLAEGVGQ